MKKSLKEVNQEVNDCMLLYGYFLNELEDGHYDCSSVKYKRVIENLEWSDKKCVKLIEDLRTILKILKKGNK